MANLIQMKTNELIQEYLTILKTAEQKIHTASSLSIIDEITIFWKRNKNIVDLILAHDTTPFDTYIFTAATYMDIDDNENYPFITLGKKHIMDDPLCDYLEVLNKEPNSNFSKKMHNQILITIQDNIKIIETCYPNILILPVRYLFDIKKDGILQNAENIFLSMFKNIDSIDDFFNLDSIEKIHNALIPEIADTLIFSDDDDMSKSFIDRFKDFQKNDDYSIVPASAEMPLFFTTIIGFIAQAMHILLISGAYSLIPYIRYDVAFKYMLKLSSNFDEIKDFQNLIFKSCISYSLYKDYNKQDFCHVPFMKYTELVKNYDFSGKIEDDLNKNNLNLNNASVDSIRSIIRKHLDLLKLNIK